MFQTSSRRRSFSLPKKQKELEMKLQPDPKNRIHCQWHCGSSKTKSEGSLSAKGLHSANWPKSETKKQTQIEFTMEHGLVFFLEPNPVVNQQHFGEINGVSTKYNSVIVLLGWRSSGALRTGARWMYFKCCPLLANIVWLEFSYWREWSQFWHADFLQCQKIWLVVFCSGRIHIQLCLASANWNSS